MRRMTGVVLVVLAAAAVAAGRVPAAEGVSSAAMQTPIATGTFDVKMAPLPFENAPEGAALSRMSLDKTFHGDLTGLSGTMTIRIDRPAHAYDFKYTLRKIGSGTLWPSTTS